MPADSAKSIAARLGTTPDIYRALARLHRRMGQPARASGVESRRLELWQHWDRKLPNNAFVRRQIAAIPANS
jgi:hypothetical protein